MFYYLYEIRNNLNGKIYVGVHKTTDMNDGYMGSGKVIRRAIIKYGVENFTKRILEQFDNVADMFAREKEVVTDEFLLREETYNLRRGGFGGFEYINKNDLRGDFTESSSRGGKKGGRITGPTNGKNAYQSKSGIHSGDYYGFKSEDNQSLMVENAKKSNTGTIHINNGMVSKRLKKEFPIPDGWVKGRLRKCG
jgi:hypothetical protein